MTVVIGFPLRQRAERKWYTSRCLVQASPLDAWAAGHHRRVGHHLSLAPQRALKGGTTSAVGRTATSTRQRSAGAAFARGLERAPSSTVLETCE